jgi:hypothetical protein
MLSDERVNRRHSRDVQDRDLRASLDDLLQQVFHDHLCARGVERTDHRQRDDAFPELHHRGGEFQHLALLAVDDFFAGLLIRLHRVQAERVEQLGGAPHLVGERLCIIACFGA